MKEPVFPPMPTFMGKTFDTEELALDAARCMIAETARLTKENEKLRDALRLAVRWMGNPRDPLGTFEDIGEWFYLETGFLRPGKSEPLECGGRDEEREQAFKDWAHRTREHVYETCASLLPGEGEKP